LFLYETNYTIFQDGGVEILQGFVVFFACSDANHPLYVGYEDLAIPYFASPSG
jgi:hypothetical protein